MSNRYTITPDEAMSILPDGDIIHTATVNGMWIGADWTREAVDDHLRKAGGAQLAGATATSMGHGLCLHAGRRLFAATDSARLSALEAAIAAESDEDGKRIEAEIRAAANANKED